MSKIHSLDKLQQELHSSFIRAMEKSKNHFFPPILKISQNKEENNLKNIMNTELLCLSKIMRPVMKQIDCSNTRYIESVSIKNNQKTLARSLAINERKLKQNRSVLKKISVLQKSQTIKLRRSSNNETINKNNQKMPIFFYEKTRKQTQMQPIKEPNVCVTDRESRISLRDKINSCKVATKKTGFPFSKKQYQHLKLSEQFDDQEQKLSIIPVQQVKQQSADFISFETYNELIVF